MLEIDVRDNVYGESGCFSGHQPRLLPLWPGFNPGHGSYVGWVSVDLNLTLRVFLRVLIKIDSQSNISLLIVIVFVFVYQADIIATIVQSAEQGAAGVVLWGDHLSEKTKTDCIEMKTYIDNFLGPLVKNLTVVTGECSAQFCSSHGRCKFQWNFVEYLQALSLGLARDLTHEWTFMSCNCYNGWGGKNCSLRRSVLRRN